MDWSGLLVDYCDGFISCLDSHSDGTHSLQRIHGEQVSKSATIKKKKKSVSFLQIFILGWTIHLIFWDLKKLKNILFNDRLL